MLFRIISVVLGIAAVARGKNSLTLTLGDRNEQKKNTAKLERFSTSLFNERKSYVT